MKWRKSRVQRICGHCGAEFEGTAKVTVCVECRAAGRRALSRVRVCEWCGKTFARAVTSCARCCTRSCGQNARARREGRQVPGTHRRGSPKLRAARTGVAYEPIDAVAVYDRDQWICGICRKKVNRTSHYNAIDAPTLDHIVPIARGGAHLYANVQCAHRICNAGKGARPHSDQLRLFG